MIGIGRTAATTSGTPATAETADTRKERQMTRRATQARSLGAKPALACTAIAIGVCCLPARPTSAQEPVAPRKAQPETDVASGTRWGKPVEGLQAGIRLLGGSSRVRVGDRIELELVLRNTTDRAIGFAWANNQAHYGWRVQRLRPTQRDEVWEIAPRYRYWQEERLVPPVAGAVGLQVGARSEFAIPMAQPKLLFASMPDSGAGATTVVCKPGAIIRLRARPVTASARGEEWLDRLETGDVLLHVVGPGVATAVAPRTGPRSEAPAGIAWGPGREVQAGLRLELWSGNPKLQEVDQPPGRFMFGVFIRNRTNRTLTVNCQSSRDESHSMYCSPEIRDGRRTVADISMLMGYGMGPVFHRTYVLKPGAEARAGHWTLVTKGRSARLLHNPDSTLTAFVEPGIHRVHAWVSASWPTRNDRGLLRTGEATFGVTPGDLAAARIAVRGPGGRAEPQQRQWAGGDTPQEEPAAAPHQGPRPPGGLMTRSSTALGPQPARQEPGLQVSVTSLGDRHIVVSEPATEGGVRGLLLTVYVCDHDAKMKPLTTHFHKLRPQSVLVDPASAKGRPWGPEQATGVPDTFRAGDISTAWASRTQDGEDEWLALEYEEPVVPARLRVFETYNPGAVNRVTVFTAKGREVVAWQGQDPTRPDTHWGVSVIPLKVDVRTQRVKVYLSSREMPGWNEIDAVGLEDASGATQWPVRATASSTYANQPGDSLIGLSDADHTLTIPESAPFSDASAGMRDEQTPSDTPAMPPSFRPGVPPSSSPLPAQARSIGHTPSTQGRSPRSHAGCVERWTLRRGILAPPGTRRSHWSAPADTTQHAT